MVTLVSILTVMLVLYAEIEHRKTLAARSLQALVLRAKVCIRADGPYSIPIQALRSVLVACSFPICNMQS